MKKIILVSLVILTLILAASPAVAAEPDADVADAAACSALCAAD